MKDFVLYEEISIKKFLDGILILYNSEDFLNEFDEEKINYPKIFKQLNSEICFQIILKYFEPEDNIYFSKILGNINCLHVNNDFNPKYMIVCIIDYFYFKSISK